MIKNQIITVFAVICILLSGGCITIATISTIKQHHPPAPTTTNFEALRQMKSLKIEVVDLTPEKHVDTAQLASAIVVAFNKEPAISTHTHVNVRVDDQAPVDGRLIVHLTGEEASFNQRKQHQLNSGHWKFDYTIQFVSSDGGVLSELKGVFHYSDYFQSKAEFVDPWSIKLQKKYQKQLSEEIIRKVFVYE
jgi:hypothetical protein